MSCIRITKTNDNESLLFNDLFNIVKDESEADGLYSYFLTDNFIEIFGDYNQHYDQGLPNNTFEEIEFNKRIDENGEPKLFLNKDLNKYYFLDKYNEPIFYPYKKQGLNKHLLVNDIKTFAKTVALNFYTDNIDFNFETLEFDLKNNITLRDYTVDFLNSKIDELMSSSDYNQLSRGIGLYNTTDNIDEWINEIKDFYSSLKTSYEVNKINENETTRDDLMRKESFLKSSKDSINNNIKLYLSLIKSNELNNYNEYSFIPFDDIYASLNKSLSNKVNVNENSEDLYEVYLSEIKSLSNIKPYFNVLYDKLSQDNVSENFKNQFVSAFNLYKKNYLGSEVSKEEDSIDYNIRNLSEVGSRKNNIVSQWYYDFTLKNEKPSKVKFIKQEIDKSKSSYSRNLKNINNEADLIPFLNKLKNDFESIGVTYTQKGFDYFLNDLDSSKNLNLEEKKQKINKVYNDIGRSLQYQIDNPNDNLFLNQKIYKDLAEAEAFFQEEGSDASIFTLGKTKWAYSLPSYLDLRIEQWKKDPKLLIDHYESTIYSKGSHWMSYLSASEITDKNERIEESKKRLENIEIGVFNSIQEEGDSKNASDNKNLSVTDALVDYMHKVLAFKKGGKVYHKTALAADKSTEYQIYYGNNSDYFNLSTNLRYENDTLIVDNKITDIFYKYFKSEYDRIAYEYNVIQTSNPKDLIPNYHTGPANSLKSQMFKSLSNNDVINLYDKDGKPLYINLDEIQDQIKNHINKKLSEGIRLTYDKLLSNNIFEFNELGKRENKILDSNIYNSYVSQHGSNRAFHHVAADMFINSIVSQVEYAKMFTGDIAYYKNIVDYKKRVPATYTDGTYMRITELDDVYFNTSIIAGVEIGYQDLKSLPASVRKYYESNINSTDAQAWITPERWEFIMKKLGKWNSVTESAFNKFYQENPSFDKKELKVLAQPLKGVYFDIVNGKPAYLKYSQAVLLPNLIKGTPLQKMYDKMVLNEAGEKLPYKDQIHELVTKDGIKVGYPVPEVTHNDQGDIISDFNLNKIKLKNSGWKLQQDLPVKGVKATDVGSQIQKNIFQGLAYNLDKDFYLGDETLKGEELIDYINDVISSLSNIGLEEVKSKLGINDNFEITNEDKLYDNIISQLKNRSGTPANLIKALESRVSPYGIPSGLNTFQNVFSSIINNNIVKIKTNGGSFIQMSDYGLNRDEAVKQNVIFTPWFENNRLKMPVKITDENGNEKYQPGGIFISGTMIAKHVPNYRSLSYDKLFGTKENDYNDGLIDKKILENIIGYRIPNQGLASNDALTVMGILPDEMGDTVIAYTGITTKTGSDFDIDKMFLMIPSFTAKKENIGSLKSYIYKALKGDSIQSTINNINSILDQIDNDYSSDIDVNSLSKLLFSESNKDLLDYSINNFVDVINNYEGDHPLINYIKEQSKNIKITKLEYDKPISDNGVELPLAEQPKAVLQNKLIESYKAVLTNKNVIEDILNPIDIDFIENDIKNLFPNLPKNDLMDMDAISDIEIKNEFMLGKAGLGQNVNSLVDAVRGSMAKLSFNDHYIKWGFVNEQGETIFDNEFSEEISDKELKEYVKTYNETADKKLDFEDVKSLKKIKLNLAMMGLVNGFVDIAKDPYIVRGNWVTQTNNVGFMLLRAGVHPFKVNAFLGQPILKEYVKFRNNKESKSIKDTNSIENNFKLHKLNQLSKDTFKDENLTINGLTFEKDNVFKSVVTLKKINSLVNTPEEIYESQKIKFINSVKRSLLNKFDLKNDEVKNNKVLQSQLSETTDSFIKLYEDIFEAEPIDIKDITLTSLRNEIKNDNNISFQLTVLELFNNWQIQSKELNDNVTASKVDVDGKGKDIISLLTSVNKIRKLLDNEVNPGAFKGFRTKLSKNGKDTILNTYIKNSLTFTYNVMRNNPKYFLIANPHTVTTFNKISSHVYGENLINVNLGEKLQKDYYSYILSGFKPFNLSKEQKNDLIDNLPNKIVELKKLLPNNALLNELIVKEHDKGEYFISMSNVKKSSSFKNTLTDSWNELLDTHPEVAEDLIKYSYLITGFNNSINQFHEYIPYEWLNENRFNSYLKSLNLNNTNVEYDRNFIDQFFRHNINDNSLVRLVFNNQIEQLQVGDAFRSGLILKSESVKNKKQIPYIVKRDIPSDFGKGTTVYYKYEGISASNDYVYTRTSPIGYQNKKGFKLMEYDVNHDFSKNQPLTSSKKTNLINPTLVNSSLIKEIRNDYFDTINNESIESKETIEDFVKNYENSKDKIESKTIEELWDFHKDVILEKHNDATIDDLIEINKLAGTQAVEDYIKNCYF